MIDHKTLRFPAVLLGSVPPRVRYIDWTISYANSHASRPAEPCRIGPNHGGNHYHRRRYGQPADIESGRPATIMWLWILEQARIRATANRVLSMT